MTKAISPNIRRRMILLGSMAVISLIVLLPFGLFHRRIIVPLAAGGALRISPPSLLATVFESRCSLEHVTKTGKVQQVTLLDAWLESPVLAIPSKHADVVLCLYGFDVGFRLLRIDARAPFRAPDPQSPLKQIVLASSCGVSEGSLDDWVELSEYLQTLWPTTFTRYALPDLDLGIIRTYPSRQAILERVAKQVKMMLSAIRPWADPNVTGVTV